MLLNLFSPHLPQALILPKPILKVLKAINQFRTVIKVRVLIHNNRAKFLSKHKTFINHLCRHNFRVNKTLFGTNSRYKPINFNLRINQYITTTKLILPNMPNHNILSKTKMVSSTIVLLHLQIRHK